MDSVHETDKSAYDPIMIEIGGTRFEMKITVGIMRKLRKLDPPIDVTRLVDDRDPSGGLWAHMRDDPSIVVDIAYEVIQGQDGATSDPQAFACMIDGDKLEELYQATLRAIVSFTPSPKNRKALTMILDRIDAVEGRLLDRAIEKIESGDVDKAIEQAVADYRSTNESSTSRASSGSTQEGTRSES